MATITIPAISIDPVSGLVDYIEEIKPYHTKVLEVLVEYIYQDCIDVTFEEAFYLSLGQPAESLLSLWGWTLTEGQSFFNCNYIFHQVVAINPKTKTWTIYSDQTGYFSVGDTILYMAEGKLTTEYTIDSISLSIDGHTRIVVVEPISAGEWQHSIVSVDPILASPETAAQKGGTFEISGNVTGDIKVGTIFDVVETNNNNGTYEASSVTFTGTNTLVDVKVDSTPISSAGAGGYAQIIPAKGVIVPASCWAKDPDTGVYEYKVGVHWPSKKHVALNQNCGSYGIEFQDSFNWQITETYLAGEQAQYEGKIYEALVETKAEQKVVGPPSYGSPLGSPHGSPIDLGSPEVFGKVYITPKDSPDWTEIGNSIQRDNPILSVDSATNSFVIDNVTNPPVNFSNWRQIFTYGVKFNVSFTSDNDGEYTVLFTTLNSSTDELTIYVIEDVSNDQTSPDGVINVRPFGYDEPTVCLNQGQSLATYAHINEKLEFKYVDYSIISSKSSVFVGSPPGSPWTGSPFIQPPNTFLVMGVPGSPSNLLPGSVLYVTDNDNEGYYKVDSIRTNWDGEGNTLIYIDTVIGSPVPQNYNTSVSQDDTGGFIQIWKVGEEPVLEGIFLEFYDTIGVHVGYESITDTQENPAQSPEIGLAPTSWDAGYWDVGGFDDHLGTMVYWHEE